MHTPDLCFWFSRGIRLALVQHAQRRGLLSIVTERPVLGSRIVMAVRFREVSEERATAGSSPGSLRLLQAKSLRPG